VVSNPTELSAKAKKNIESDETRILVSSISCAEIACLVHAKRIELDRHWKLWFRHFTSLNQWEVIPIDLSIVEESYSLPGLFHRDPADRFLVATSRLYRAPIVTADSKILEYPHVESIW
jgi:PIN domain nuclease of toxin-antitoxin system